jgi:hypothetical protein
MRAGLPRPHRQPRLIAGVTRGQLRSTAAGHALGLQPSSPSACWTIAGAVGLAPGQDAWEQPNAWPVSWLIT